MGGSLFYSRVYRKTQLCCFEHSWLSIEFILCEYSHRLVNFLGITSTRVDHSPTLWGIHPCTTATWCSKHCILITPKHYMYSHWLNSSVSAVAHKLCSCTLFKSHNAIRSPTAMWEELALYLGCGCPLDGYSIVDIWDVYSLLAVAHSNQQAVARQCQSRWDPRWQKRGSNSQRQTRGEQEDEKVTF